MRSRRCGSVLGIVSDIQRLKALNRANGVVFGDSKTNVSSECFALCSGIGSPPERDCVGIGACASESSVQYPQCMMDCRPTAWRSAAASALHKTSSKRHDL